MCQEKSVAGLNAKKYTVLAMTSLNFEHEFNHLREFSARIGKNPCLVQGAGGNSSIKDNGTMWIKASGTWLANASEQTLFVPVALNPLLDALETADPRAEKATDFIVDAHEHQTLRPSIETTLHAVMPQRVVVHVHCVDTIALAIQTTAQKQLGECLKDFNWLWVPYFRPGLPLSRYISEHYVPGVNVVVLGNHGLVVAAETVDEVNVLLKQVRSAVKQEVRHADRADTELLTSLAQNTRYKAAEFPATHTMAFDTTSVSIASEGSLYPDHVIFLGEGTTVVNQSDALSATLTKMADQPAANAVSVVIPGAGVLMHETANASQQAMARCLSDVCLRVPIAAPINYLSSSDEYQLLNWEAETYRQTIAT